MVFLTTFCEKCCSSVDNNITSYFNLRSAFFLKRNKHIQQLNPRHCFYTLVSIQCTYVISAAEGIEISSMLCRQPIPMCNLRPIDLLENIHACAQWPSCDQKLLFRDPVDGDEVPDYYDIVTDPICLSDILDKIDNASGTQKQSNGDAAYTMAKLMADVRLLLDNAYLYNADDSFEVKQAKKLENSFVRLCRDSISDSVELRRLRNMFDTTR